MQASHDAFAAARVVVVGDVILDRYWFGSTSRISPEAPVPVVHVDQRADRPGGAANVALNAVALGARVMLVGLVGADEAGATVRRLLEDAGVRCALLDSGEAGTVVKLRVLSQHQQLIRLDFEKPAHAAVTSGLRERFETVLADADVVILSDYAKGTLLAVQELIALARAAGKRVVVDPKGTDFARYRGATLVTPNQKELEAVVGACPDLPTLASRGEALREALGLEALLVTRGEHGMSLIARDEPVLHLDAQAREVFDVTGAGDTVCAVMATALAAGHDLRHATALANAAAGVVVGKLGTATVSAAELEQALRADAPAHAGVVDEAGLIEQVASARRRGHSIVMTNGCFDLLHAGHVACLESARKLGDRLVVAVNDDASVTALKGAGRPLVPLAQRMQVLAALAVVDWVVAFTEATPARLIARVLPDVLVKGGDYHGDDVAGGDVVRAHGGRVVVLDYVEGCSTSAIIDQARRGAAGGSRE
ncbi:MAG: bifunctional D-glycero-beta-D-manno-heptose-7-phosphate kinase/D-glycero-beta-D-manno-heptose 1-phosphate adenylyltransferase HldE [Gammaproteobacteria bacterium]|nr:bifunctional D-glycero-beta-D-manno-heptose-7-phosphate kinase/D-glycero-beta-D-manno-heptose 1-phosphate adenylyltransferase HldE [Gammaproteobacteria bacterium]